MDVGVARHRLAAEVEEVAPHQVVVARAREAAGHAVVIRGDDVVRQGEALPERPDPGPIGQREAVRKEEVVDDVDRRVKKADSTSELKYNINYRSTGHNKGSMD